MQLKALKYALVLIYLVVFLDSEAQNNTAWGDLSDGTYLNPILFADYNNPDVIKVGEDFYMVAASHHFVSNPILHSTDMVNWEIIARPFRSLEIDERYDQPGQAYQHGSWAPSLVYHKGTYYMYFCTPLEGLFMTTAKNPGGTWSPVTEVKRVLDWEDPYPFWDDDGQAYMLRSEVGAGPVIIHKMSKDGTEILDGGTLLMEGPNLEGPKMMKRNGYYYIHAPEGGIRDGYQVVFRSKYIYGPYEKMTNLEQGSTNINGPHQGSWIDLDNGESWFYHFQQIEGYGRVLWLEPGRWENNWPLIGLDYDRNGVGEPVIRNQKPTLNTRSDIMLPASTDEFSNSKLGLQWFWNHNPDNDHWSLTERPGFLRLKALPLYEKTGYNHHLVPIKYEESILFAKNTLAQHVMGKDSEATIELHTSEMKEGQYAGLSLFCRDYLSIGVARENNQNKIRWSRNGVNHDAPDVAGEVVYFKATVRLDDGVAMGQLSYSLDGKHFQNWGMSFPIVRAWFEGTKYALFSYNTSGNGGIADFNWFRYKHDGPQDAD